MKTITWSTIRNALNQDGCTESQGLAWSVTTGLPANEHTGIVVNNYINGLMGTESAVSAFRVNGSEELVWVPQSILRTHVPARFRRLRGLVTHPSFQVARNATMSIRRLRNEAVNSALPDPLSKPLSSRMYDLIYSLPLAPGKHSSSLWSHRRTFDMYNYQYAVGVEFESYGAIERRELIRQLPIWTRVATDGSISPPSGQNGHEIRVLLDRSIAEPRLFNLCKRFATLGLRVNKSCGLHIHLDARSMTFPEVVARAKVMDKWLHSLMELLPVSRRNNRYCQWGIDQQDRYRAVNVYSWHTHKTIEVRCGSATLDYNKVLSWLRLVELIRAMPKGPKAGSCIATLEQLPLPTHDLAFWRARHRELNPAQYSAAATDTTTDSE
jgi:Putative amidoligase enzyme